ncbi:MAG: hypothetical protein ACPGLV_03825 [Bacteroidia bacterium]
MKSFLIFFLFVFQIIEIKAQDSSNFYQEPLDTPDRYSFRVYDSLMNEGVFEYRSGRFFFGQMACEMRIFEEYGVNVSNETACTTIGSYGMYGVTLFNFNERLFARLEKIYGEEEVFKLKERLDNCDFCGCNVRDTAILSLYFNSEISFDDGSKRLSKDELEVFKSCIGKSQPFWDQYGVGLSLKAYYGNSRDSILVIKRFKYLRRQMIKSGFDKTLIETELIKNEEPKERDLNSVSIGMFYPETDGEKYIDPDLLLEEEEEK